MAFALLLRFSRGKMIRETLYDFVRQNKAMSEHHIAPEKVTKPIQLLAAWLVGLIAVNGSFLLGANHIATPPWAGAVLVIAAVANVPIFILALFLLQTKFRPQMQEDSYYAQYLRSEKEYGQRRSEGFQTQEVIDQIITQTAERITKSLGAAGKGQEKPIENILRESQIDSLVTKFSGSRVLSELYLASATWPDLVKEFGHSEPFIQDIEPLLAEGLVVRRYKGYLNCTLTDLGRQVAAIAEKNGVLWHQLELISRAEGD
jgi:hypothetical protein